MQQRKLEVKSPEVPERSPGTIIYAIGCNSGILILVLKLVRGLFFFLFVSQKKKAP